MTHPVFYVRQQHQPFPHVHISGPIDCTIALRGATIMEWRHEGQPIIDGYQNYEELRGQDGVRSGVLAPYAGRIRDAKYWLDGSEHDLKPGQADRTVFHGFARDTDFSLVRVDYEPGEVSLAFCADIRPDQVPGYPFRLRLQTTYKLTRDGVSLTIEASNLDSKPAPISVGWHPYFRIGSSVNHVVLNIPADRALVLDETFNPDHEAGDKEIIDTDLDFRNPRAIGPTRLDTCYTDITVDVNGLSKVTLGTTESDERIQVWQRGGLVYAYTGDRLERDPRRSIAIEAISHIPDAFNASEHIPTVRVAPGQSRIFQCGFAYSPSSARITEAQMKSMQTAKSN
ncbi:aldose 1-epimerase [Pseudarthrobacter oxydans]|uniref:aldose 1-epimerase n=1 Tax=Pseudarthrobacter oxydans TaxID=1671 RepID=UPI00341E1006